MWKATSGEMSEGDTIEIEMPAARLGRIAAQTSRQMIMQKIREAEHDNVFAAFRGRIGEIVSGTVSSVVRRDLYVLVGKTEMLLPAKERIPTEDYSVGDSIKAIISEVKQELRKAGALNINYSATASHNPQKHN